VSKKVLLILAVVLALAFGASRFLANGTDGMGQEHDNTPHSHNTDSQDQQPHDVGDNHDDDSGAEHAEHSGGHEEGGAHEHGDDSYSVGKPATAADADRTIRVGMADSMTYTFNPELASIRDGEIINFVVTNDGKINHEFSIGNQDDQIEHAEMMLKMPNMVHADPNTVTVAPGDTASLAWQFEGDDLVVFACNIPGHYQAGMFQKTAIVSEASEDHSDHDH